MHGCHDIQKNSHFNPFYGFLKSYFCDRKTEKIETNFHREKCLMQNILQTSEASDSDISFRDSLKVSTLYNFLYTF